MPLPHWIVQKIHAFESPGEITEIQEWFAAGSRDPNIQTTYGWPILYLAANQGHSILMRFLLEIGADVNATTDLGSTPLHAAVNRGDHDGAVLLLDHGANVDARTQIGHATFYTPLIFAARFDNCRIIRLLLHRGADYGARSKENDTAEDRARNYNCQWTHRLLVDVRRAGGWRGYVRYPRFRLLMLRILAEQGRAETKDALLVRLFPAGPPPPGGAKRPREAYCAQKGGRIPRGIFAHIAGYWRSSRDYLP